METLCEDYVKKVIQEKALCMQFISQEVVMSKQLETGCGRAKTEHVSFFKNVSMLWPKKYVISPISQIFVQVELLV